MPGSPASPLGILVVLCYNLQEDGTNPPWIAWIILCLPFMWLLCFNWREKTAVVGNFPTTAVFCVRLTWQSRGYFTTILMSLPGIAMNLTMDLPPNQVSKSA